VAGDRATGASPPALFAFTDAELLPERTLQGRREVDVLCPRSSSTGTERLTLGCVLMCAYKRVRDGLDSPIETGAKVGLLRVPCAYGGLPLYEWAATALI